MKPSFTFECQNIWRFEARKHGQSSYVPPTEAPSGEKERYKIIDHLTKENVNSFDNVSVTNTSASSINWANFATYHFEKAGRSNSEWKQFPMFDINRKFETILGPVNRTGLGTMEIPMNGRKLHIGESSLSPHLIEFASEEHQFQRQGVAETTKQKVQTYDSTSGSFPHTDEDNEPFTSKVVYKEDFANTDLSYLGKDLCNSSSHSTSIVSERENDDEQILRRIGGSGTRLKNGSKSLTHDIPQPPLTGEDVTESGHSCQSRVIKSNKLENCCNVRTVRAKQTSNCGNIRNGGPQKYVDAAGLLFTENMNMDLSREDQMVGESTVSATVKRSSFFQMLTLPSLFHRHSQQEENLAPLVGLINRKHSDEIDTNFMDKPDESSGKTDIMCTDFPPASSFPAVGTSSKSQKDVAFVNANLTGIADTSTSRSPSMAVDHLSCIPRPSSPIESTLKGSDATWKWVKRLQPNSLDSTPATKKVKLGDSSSGVEAHNLVNQVAKVHSCSGDSVALSPWIRRWCRQTQEMSPVLMQPESERSNVPLEKKLEAKQLPSLAAMALVGKSANNFRPCKFQRRGSTTVWHTEEF